MDRLKDKVAIITGCSSGMGEAGVKLFLKEGAKVVATSRVYETLKEAFPDESESLLTVKLDVTSEAEWDVAVKRAVEKFGKIDILVNNAGRSVHKPFLEETLEGWNHNIATNFTSVWLGMRAVIPYMQKNGGGSIVNCLSITALRGSADFGAPAYMSAKSGARALTQHVAANFAKDSIRANALFPGSVYTGAVTRSGVTFEQVSEGFKKWIPLPPHFGMPDDIAYGYLYLASDESKFVSGCELWIDGGQLAGMV